MTIQYGTTGTGPYGLLPYGTSTGTVTPPNPLQMPVISVEFSPTAMFETPNWQDITKLVMAGNITIGRQHELDRVEAAVLSLTLDNRSGEFNRFDTGGVYYFSGNGLVPGNPVRVIANNFDVYYGYMTSCQANSTDEVNSTATMMAADLFKSLAIQPMSNTTIYPDLVVADEAVVFWRFGDDYGEQITTTATVAESIANLTATVYGLTVGQQSFDQPGPIYIDPATALTLPVAATIFIPAAATTLVDPGQWSFEIWVDNITGSGGFYVYPEVAGIPTTGNLWIGPGNSSTGSDGQVVYGHSTTGFITSGTKLVNDGLPHHIVITGSAQVDGIVNMYIDGQGVNYTVVTSSTQAAPWIGGSPMVILCNGTGGVTVSNLALYAPALTPVKVANHYNTGAMFQNEMTTGDLIGEILTFCNVPLDMQNIAEGNTLCQGATSDLTQTNALDFCTSAQQTESGILYVDQSGIITFLDRYFPLETISQILITDDDTGYPYESNPVITQDDLDLWTIVQASRVNGQLQQVTNLVAASVYGQRMVQGLTNLLMTTDTDALGLANWTLLRYYFPIVRVSGVTLSSTAKGGIDIPYMLQLFLWDAITFRRATAPGQVTPFVQENVIEQIRHQWTPDHWDTTWSLSPYELDFSVFTLGGSVSGCTTTIHESTVTASAAVPGSFGLSLINFNVSGAGIAASTSVVGVTSSNVGTRYELIGGIPQAVCTGPDGNLWVADTTGLVWKVTTAGVTTQYTLPGSYPNSICSGPDGNLWVGDGLGAVWKVTTAGVATKHEIVSHITALQTGICVGSDNNLWFADGFEGAVFKVTTSGAYTRYNLTASNPSGIVSASDNNLWVSDAVGAVWKVTIAGASTRYNLSAISDPSGICQSSSGDLWVNDGYTGNGVWQVTLSGVGTKYPLSSPQTSLNSICIGSDGNVWTPDINNGYVWQVEASNPTVNTAFNIVESEPYGICSGPDGNLWVTDLLHAIWKVPTVNLQTLTLSNTATASHASTTLSFTSNKDLLDSGNVLAY